MKKLLRSLPALILLLPLAAFSRTLPAWSGAMGFVGQDHEVQMLEGELVKVDLENRTFTIKLEDKEEVQFQFDGNTMVEGKENGVQGLAGDTGTRLAVRYKESEGKKTATKIEIKKKLDA
jgi:hypothetical protein